MKTAHDLVVAAKSRVQEIPVQDAEQAIREADVLVDVREADEYAQEHIPGAMNLPLSRLRDGLHTLPRDRRLVLYCLTGKRSWDAASALRQLGYDVAMLSGGIETWRHHRAARR